MLILLEILGKLLDVAIYSIEASYADKICS